MRVSVGKVIIAFAALAIIKAPEASAGTRVIELELVAGGFALPTYVTHAGDGSGRLFVVEQRGRIRVINPDGTVRPTDFLNLGTGGLDLVSQTRNERGLFAMAFHPDYDINGKFYVHYTSQGDSHGSVVAEFTVSGDPNVANTVKTDIIGPIAQPQSNHNGGMIAFGPDANLYIALGDGGNSDDVGPGHTATIGNAQDTTNLLGNILRIDVDNPAGGGQNYGIPASNPFSGGAGGNREEIYAYGLRNPWRFSFDRGSGRLFCGDVGQNRMEEIDIIERGDNLGWHITEGDECFNLADRNTPLPNCDRTGLVDPIFAYFQDRVAGGVGNAVIGGYVYRGQEFLGLDGLYFYSDNSASNIWVLEENGGGWTSTELLVTNNLFITSFGEDEEGELYVCSAGTGNIFKINDVSVNAARSWTALD